jgi:hypothetical protein
MTRHNGGQDIEAIEAIGAGNYHSRALLHCALRQQWPIIDRFLDLRHWLRWRAYYRRLGLVHFVARMDCEQVWPVPAMNVSEFDPEERDDDQARIAN